MSSYLSQFAVDAEGFIIELRTEKWREDGPQLPDDAFQIGEWEDPASLPFDLADCIRFTRATDAQTVFESTEIPRKPLHTTDLLAEVVALLQPLKLNVAGLHLAHVHWHHLVLHGDPLSAAPATEAALHDIMQDTAEGTLAVYLLMSGATSMKADAPAVERWFTSHTYFSELAPPSTVAWALQRASPADLTDAKDQASMSALALGRKSFLREERRANFQELLSQLQSASGEPPSGSERLVRRAFG